MKEPAARKVAAVMKEAAAAVKNETAQASCRRRPLPPLLALHILPEQRDRDETPPRASPRILNTLRSKAWG